MEHEHNEEEEMAWWKIIVSGVMLIVGLLAPCVGFILLKQPIVSLAWYIIAFAFVGLPVMKEAWEEVLKGDIFSEFMLMTIACIGAFAIGEYPEAVAVMLLYCIGEALQDRAVDRSRNNIEELLAFKPTVAHVVENGKIIETSPADVKIGDVIEIKAGERVPLDGILLSNDTAFNTAALTGESMPRILEKGKEVLAGMIATDSVSQLKVTHEESESAVARILKMVEEASERKAPTELFVRRFAHIYTPIVILLAVLTILLPMVYAFFDSSYTYIFSDWFRRALVFLVISCPCALVVSIPLGYFAGIGLASKHGILFKGSNYIDAITDVDVVMLDKTGTLTKGEFAVQQVVGLAQDVVEKVAAMEKSSNHPIAKAILKYCPTHKKIDAQDIAGYGLVNDEWTVGNLRLFDKQHITYNKELKAIPETVVAVAKNAQYVGYFILADTLKEDAKIAISSLSVHAEMLSGDRQELVNKVAKMLGIKQAYGDLLPADKVAHIEQAQKQGNKVAVVGDGINDAPMLAISDVGIAMGGLGADMAVETADVIIQTDQPSKVSTAIKIGKYTRKIVRENIILALSIKFLVMLLGVFGVANLWMAVFADSGVALLAVLNSTRIFFHKENS